MGILSDIAKRLKGHSQKDLDKALYKRRNKKLNKAITAGKVPAKDLKALKTVRAQKDTPVKKKPAAKWGAVVDRKDQIDKMSKEGVTSNKPKKKAEDKPATPKRGSLKPVADNLKKGTAWLLKQRNANKK